MRELTGGKYEEIGKFVIVYSVHVCTCMYMYMYLHNKLCTVS
jgi:hypothetical protein